MELQGAEPEGQDRAPRLGGIPSPPERHADPVTELGEGVGGVHEQTDVADQGSIRRRDCILRQGPCREPGPVPGDPLLGRAVGIGMRNRERGVGDREFTRQLLDDRRIRELERSQDEPLRVQSRLGT